MSRAAAASRTNVELSRAPLSGAPYFAVEFEPETGELLLLDQTALPSDVVYRRYRRPEDVAEAIRALVVRGAPAIGITAAYALVLAALSTRAMGPQDFLVAHAASADRLGRARPTAVNLGWAVARMSRKAAEVASLSGALRARALLQEAEAIHREDVEACKAMASLGAQDVSDGATILTHCNAGAIATGGYGTALGVVRAAWQAGKRIKVLADETRPFFQGARLTAWELHQDGIPVEVITDSMAASFFKRGEITTCIVGSDRIAANGDVANKIGTYNVAVLARFHDVPFTVAAPWSTVDLAMPNGDLIPIEERSRDEVAKVGTTTLVADNITCRHPAFDVTPARLVTAVYTERGTFRPARGETPAGLLAARAR